MIIFFQEIILQLFLWLLRMIDGLMEIFGGMTGVTAVMYHGEKVNIIEYLTNSTGVSTIFWCVFILAVGLTCIFTIVAIVKNMIANNRNLSSIIGKFFLALLGTMAMLVVVILGILIANALLLLVANIFQVENTTKLSSALLEACVGDWINGYTIAEVDIKTVTVRELFGNWNGAPLFGIWPTHWDQDGMVNPDTFMYLPSMVASIAVVIVLIISLLNLAKRIYEIVLLYIIMPVSMSTLPLDDGAKFKMWRETFVTKIIIAYGSVFAVNVFILLLPILTKMRIPSLGSFGNSMFVIFMIIGGAMLIPAAQALFARLFGQADDMHAGGSFVRSAFYGGRIAGALTFGTASKIIHGIHHSRHHENNRRNNNSDESESGERYSESESSGSEGESE